MHYIGRSYKLVTSGGFSNTLNELEFFLVIYILTKPSFQSIHFDRNTMIFYQNTDDGQNPLLKQCSIANFSSAEVSTLLKCDITHYSPILFHTYDRKSNWIFLGLFLTKAMTPLNDLFKWFLSEGTWPF